jgi:signal transduction histidine kinase
MAAVGATWLGWLGSRRLGAPEAATWALLALLAASGGLLVSYEPVSIGFVAVAALGAGVAFSPRRAIGIGVVGVAAIVVSVAVLGSPYRGEVIAEGIFASAAGLMAGASRRQYERRTEQAEQLLAERVRADAERDRAAALAERNRLGREIHDVLAHSLGALSVQLDAADALLEQGGEPGNARELVRRARRLAVEGLNETRQAVHVLRDEPLELVEHLTALAEREGAMITVTGMSRTLDAEQGLALYRAAQEALSNARKHAPGARVSMRLGFEPHETLLVIENAAADDVAAVPELSATGGGYGLRGMRERIEPLGGSVHAERGSCGWIVEVTVPA